MTQTTMDDYPKNAYWISPQLKDMDTFELTKVGIEFFCANLQHHKYSEEQKEELVDYFRSRLSKKEEVEYDQTS